jgi:hypothetical protein
LAFSGPAAWAAAPQSNVEASSEAAIKASLDESLKAFNVGNFEGFLHDYAPSITYNGMTVDRSRLVEINKELRDSFPNLSMRYDLMRVNALDANQATATTVSEFSGETANYDNSGLAASYHESGQIMAMYQHEGDTWTTHQLDVAWNDAYIDIGQVFGLIGFTQLPTINGANQPYRLRLYVGEDERPGVGVAYAYAIAPLKSVIEKAGAESLFGHLDFKPVPAAGIDRELTAPKEPGTYAHLLVVNKFWRAGANESIVGQKIYTRLVKVE